MTAPAEPADTAAAPRATASRPTTAGATTTRVELEKIDRVVNMVGELVIAQAMLGQVVHALPEEVRGSLLQVLEEVVHHTRELKDSVMSMRAQQVSAVFQRMPRLVRELAIKTAKKCRLEMAGENTEVDRSIIERLGDPLDPYHPQCDRPRHRGAVGAGRGRQARRRHDPACRRAPRQPDRHRDQRRRRRHQSRARSQKGARPRPGQRRRRSQRRRNQQSDLPAGLFHRGERFRHFGTRRRHGRRAPQHSGPRRPHFDQIRTRPRHDDPAGACR